MGTAAYNRGSEAVRRQIQADVDAHRRHEAFFIIENLNAMPKAPGAPTPFGPVDLVQDPADKGWWALDPKKGFAGRGYWFKTLGEAVRAFNIEVTGFVRGKYTAVPIKRAA
jgi:hypothetical protein